MNNMNEMKKHVKNLFEASEILDSAGFDFREFHAPSIALAFAQDDSEKLSEIVDEMRVELRFKGTDVSFFRKTDKTRFFELVG